MSHRTANTVPQPKNIGHLVDMAMDEMIAISPRYAVLSDTSLRFAVHCIVGILEREPEYRIAFHAALIKESQN